MSVIFWTADNFKSTYKFDRFYFQPIVLFDGPVELDMLAIFKNIDDKKSYILTLYTKTFQIHIDRDNISITDDKSLPDENIEVNDDIIKMNLYDRTFIKGILEQINPKFISQIKYCRKKNIKLPLIEIDIIQIDIIRMKIHLTPKLFLFLTMLLITRRVFMMRSVLLKIVQHC